MDLWILYKLNLNCFFFFFFFLWILTDSKIYAKMQRWEIVKLPVKSEGENRPCVILRLIVEF